MESICSFILSDSSGGELKTIHFVYETEHKKLKWPRVAPFYSLFLVTRGQGALILQEFGTYSVKAGDLFVIHPGARYKIQGDHELTYFYISFVGTRAAKLIEETVPAQKDPLRTGFEGLIPFWKQAIQRIHSKNAHLITESVLLYTLSYLSDPERDRTPDPQSKGVIDDLIHYVDHNYTDPALNLKKVADIFGYTDKYLSHLFKEQMSLNWTEYLNRLRIHCAVRLIDEGFDDTQALFEKCGYCDPIYFSKVFKKITGKTPHAYIRQKRSLP